MYLRTALSNGHIIIISYMTNEGIWSADEKVIDREVRGSQE
jgi:hypothetical protein